MDVDLVDRPLAGVKNQIKPDCPRVADEGRWVFHDDKAEINFIAFHIIIH